MNDENFGEDRKASWSSGLGLKGSMVARLYGPDGELKTERKIKAIRVEGNTVTTFGDHLVADQLSDAGLVAPSHMAIGTGTGGGANDNSLQTELDRNALTSTTQGSGAADNDVVYVGDWAAGDGTGAITEAGIFNHASNPGLYVYSSFTVINKGASDTLQITWTVTFGAS